MNFGQAIEALKRGERVSRSGWNGKNMWLALQHGAIGLPANLVSRERANYLPRFVSTGSYIVMYTAQGTWQPGWLASQADMLAEDWEIVL